MNPSSSLQYFVADWVLPIGGAPIRQGFLRVDQGRITACGAIDDLPLTIQQALPEIQPNSLITPGLINTHIHLEQSFPERIPLEAGSSFEQWLINVLETMRSADSEVEKLTRCRQGALELLTTGTTCVNDIASGPESLQALDELGLRGIVSPEFFHPEHHAPLHLDKALTTFQSLSAKYQGHPRLQVGLSPHSAYNVSPVAWQAMVEACNSPLVHTHLAEFVDEARYLAGEPETLVHRLHQRVLQHTFSPQTVASSPTAYLHAHDLLSRRLVVAHAIHTNLTDRYHFASHRVAVAHCPRSNLNLHGQTLHWSDWAKTGLDIGLGTDGRLSTEDLDLRAEARCAMNLHGWNAEQALRTMTLEGAKVLHQSDRIGSLIPGKAADFVIWQSRKSVESPEMAVLDPSTYVHAVYVEGRLCYQSTLTEPYERVNP